MENLRERVAGLSPAEKRALISRLLAEKAAAAEPAGFPLSFAQERLWFLDQWEPGNPAYNIHTAVRVTGQLDVTALVASFADLVARHEALRTVFTVRSSQPVQVILPAFHPPLPVIDLRGLEESRCSREADRLARREARRSFELERGPLVRMQLLSTEAEAHLLLLTIHHIISDGWTLGVLIRELGALYVARRAGQASPLPELAIQYVDFAHWQREHLRGEVLEAKLDYWRSQLAGAAVLELPTDRPRPAILDSSTGRTATCRLPATLGAALKHQARRSQATFFMILLTAFAVLMRRYSGQTDVLVGTPVTNRERTELEALVGILINVLVLRIDLAGEPTFEQALQRVRQKTLEAYEHQDLPFEVLVSALQPDRDLSHAPLFQVLFQLQQAHVTNFELPGLILHPEPADNGTSKFELTLVVDEQASGLEVLCEYNTELFDPTTIRRLQRHLGTLLEAIVADPGVRTAALTLLPASGRQQLLTEWNDSAPRSPSLPAVLHEAFAAQVARTPEAVAVSAGERFLSYRELDRQALVLGDHLRRLGVAAERPVAVLMGRCPELVIGLLGILRAGGAYVPLDPDHPEERLRLILDELAAVAGPPIVLTRRRRSALAQGLGVEPRRCLVLDAESWSATGAGRDLPPTSPEQLAYTIYTSGSTGRPKGVQVSHGALTNFLGSMAHRPGLGGGDVLASVTTPSFDIFGLEIHLPLIRGARVDLVDQETAADGALLAARLEAVGATLLQATPATWRLLVESGWKGLPQLRALCGGEALVPRLAAEIASRTAALWNLYGPTETTIWSAVDRVPAGAPSVSIGRPIAATRIYLLGRANDAVVPGAAGELHIGGLGLARGYLDRPGLTAERFVPDSYSEEPGVRLYRTGDLARYRPDGALEYLGRLDHQVKLRGFRIELGEIEAVLNAQASVASGVVVASGASDADRRLLAYVVPADDAGLVPDALRAALRERLPEYMVPAIFVPMERFPLNSSGKVDRRALPVPGRARAAGKAFVAPRSRAEVEVARIWCEILELDEVSVEESFFELGGHSLLATRVVSRLARDLAVEVSLRQLFQAPTVAGLAAILEGRSADEGRALPPLEPVSRDAELPLSFAQERLWILDQVAELGAAYSLPVALHLAGRLDTAALELGLRDLVQRHETLRTTFGKAAGGEPAQRVGPVPPCFLDRVDLRSVPRARQPLELQRRIAEEFARPFDLARGPLFRALLLTSGDDEHVLVVNMHHIISDAWSMGVAVRDLCALYRARVEGVSSPLPALRVQYGDFATWQRGWLTGGELERQLTYWRQQLAGAPTALELPTDRPRPPVKSFRGGQRRTRFDARLTADLDALARREGVTLFMILVASGAALFARLSGQKDIVVGSPIANRHHADVEGMIGFFVNNLVMRTDLSGDPSGSELLARVRETALEAYEHQDLPFERLVEALAVERSLDRTPIFQAVLAVQNTPAGEPRLPGLSLSPYSFPIRTSKFDLGLNLTADGSGLDVLIEYDSDLFDATTMGRWLGHFRSLITAQQASPAARLSELALLGPEQRHQLLAEWNDTAKPCPQVPLVHELFAAHARRRPEAPAVVAGEVAWSYAEVEARANRLAHYLRACGVGPEVLVAMCTGRTSDRVVGIVAVLKAGGAYVSLDPSHPRERLAYLLEDAGAAVILTERRYRGDLPSSSARVVCLDEDWAAIGGDEKRPPESGTGPDHLAYVVYTSGSTGRPKGVAIPHAGLMNLVRWHQDLYEVTSEDRGTQVASPAFDASIWELWPYLAAGASVHIPDEETRLSSPGMIRWWVEQGITLAYLMTPLAEGVLEEGMPAQLEHRVRALIIGGDRLRRRPDPEMGFRLMNHYGPAEYSVTSTVVEVVPGDTSRPTIGRPVDNTAIYLVDRTLQLVLPGAPGELYIGGVGLARGYHERPGLTAEKFLPDLYGEVAGERLYRTGDLVRWLPDGDLDFLGRIDHQVKLRGLRIELGEIETALLDHPAVADGAVLLHEDGVPRLVAYFVAQPSEEVSPALLRSFLGKRLPEYMVPVAWVELEDLPLMPNGKIDRRALPAPQTAEDVGDARGAPGTPLEKVVTGVFEEVLGLEGLDPGANFFALGGHSLLATQAVSRLAEQLGVEVPLAQLFQTPRVTDLAAYLEAAGARQAPPLVPVARDGSALPLSFAQERLWLLDQLGGLGSTYNVPAVLRFGGPLEGARLEMALRHLVARHEALRTTFRTRAGIPEQVVGGVPGEISRMIDLGSLPSATAEAELERRVADEVGRPFDLVTGPLLRVLLLRRGPREHVLVLNQHHIVSDAWSTGILIRELTAIYTASARGGAVALPELPIQYADFAVWQRQWLAGAELERQLEYWRRSLEGAPNALELPTDRPRGPVQSYRGATRTVRLDGARTAALTDLGRGGEATLFMVLLAAWAVHLSRLSGQSELVIGSPIADRGHRELEGLIGFFINTLVMRVEASADLSFDELLARVREVALGAYAHQDLPFEKLVDELDVERSLDRPPIFQVMLVLQNAPRESLEVEGLTVIPVPFDAGSAKFDLTLAAATVDDGLALSLEHNADLFDATTAHRWLSELERLLEAVCAAPGRRLAEHALLSAAQRHQTTAEWNDTAAPMPEGCLHHLFEAQASRTPEAVALSAAAESLSYRELDRRAGRLARRLRALGVTAESRVGIALERSTALVVGLLGILKAGAAYVPLDPDYPQDRLDFMASDARLMALLTLERLRPRWPSDLPLICLDRESLGAGTGDRLAGEGSATSLAYVIYTSGSTGRPKGAMNSHRGIVNRLLWLQEVDPLDATDRVLQKTPLSFDVSVWELFWPLVAGAQLVMARPGGHREGSYLIEVIRQRAVTTLHFVPSMLKVFLEESGVESCRSLRRVITSGEALGVEHVRRFQARSEAELLNLYGPTEAAVEVSFWPCARSGAPRTIPIGRPITNLVLHLADRRLRPVPIGVAGELLIGGAGVARGYLDRPGLTAEKFVSNPFAGTLGERLYRTGDLTSWRVDGAIEFLGRIDHQVKLRGQRIELGEIEAALVEHPGVADAVVMVRGEGIEAGLNAWIVPDEARRGELSADESFETELRGRLRERLPEYMVPSFLVLLEALPLLPNGKIDRKALPDPQPQRGARAGRRDPETPTETWVASTFAEVLGVELPGLDESFFDLGGHSLLATRVVARLQDHLGVEVPLQAFFQAPSVAALARFVDEESRSSSRPPLVAMPRGGDSEGPVLSFAQERLWFLDQLSEVGTAYSLPVVLRLGGDLNEVALEASFRELVRRHEVLRTTFRKAASGAPSITVGPIPRRVIRHIDLAGIPEPRRRAALTRHLADELASPFDLTSGPLMRVLLLRCRDHEHVLVVNMHHIISDGWSMGVMVREIAILYQDLAAGERASLPDLAVQYSDFATWQRQWLGGGELQRQLEHWRRQLDGVPSVLELPTDRPRPPVQTFRGVQRAAVLGGAIRALEELGRRQGATFFMTLLAAWTAFLSRISGQGDLVVGSPVANRLDSAIEELIGFFVNTLTLRSRTADDPSFSEHLARCREVALDAFAHQEVPFEKLVEELRPERDFSRSPIFQVMLVLQNLPLDVPDSTGWTLEPMPFESTVAKFDLTLLVSQDASGGTEIFEYNTDLFDATTIERWAGHWHQLLEDIVQDGEQRLSELGLLGVAERHQLLREWNDTAAESAEGVVFSDLFSAQVRRTPDAIAVVQGNRRLSYAALDRRSQRLASYLANQGLGPEHLVGVGLTRSPAMIVAILAVLRAGAAYLPLDPAYPADRLAYMVEDADLSLILTEKAARQRLAVDGCAFLELETQGVPVNHQAKGVKAAGSEVRKRPSQPEHLAYVIYTSGSTGRPKGVALSHEGLVHLALAQRDLFDLGTGDRVLQFFALSFDGSVWEVAMALTSGAALVLGPPDLPLSGPVLEELVQREQVNVATLPPSVLAATDGSLPSLGLLIAAGEASSAELVARWGAGRRFVNAYGPSETTVCATAGDCREAEAPPPIGRAILHARCFVADRRLQVVAQGIVGELLIGGKGLARGYLGRGGTTAERFLPHPWPVGPGERLYRTGDLARRLADGRIVFLGRRDHQVKLRGFRIELGEIEEALAEQPAVRDAAVLVHGEHLVAYLTSAGEGLEEVALRRSLAERLPAYMVPTAFVVLDTLPLLPSGKLDRGALPEPSQAEPSPETLPRDDLELRIAQIWCELLGRTIVGVRESFFELGGHSLLAVRLVAQVEQQLGQSLPLTTLFDHPTVEGLAAYLRRGDGARNEPRPVLVELATGGPGRPFYCVHPVGGNVFGYLDLARRLGRERPFYGLQSPDPRSTPELSLEDMAARYVAAITAQASGPYLLGGWSMGGVVAYEMARQLCRAGEWVGPVVLIDAPSPARGEPGAVNRATLLKLFIRDLLGREFPEGFEELPDAEELRGLDFESLGLDQALALARAMKAIPPDTDSRLLEDLFETFRRNHDALQGYRPGPYPGSVAWIRAEATASVSPEDGWSELVEGGVVAYEVAGNHYSILQPPGVEAVAERISTLLHGYEGAREAEPTDVECVSGSA